jgi:hypothetical protein
MYQVKCEAKLMLRRIPARQPLRRFPEIRRNIRLPNVLSSEASLAPGCAQTWPMNTGEVRSDSLLFSE